MGVNCMVIQELEILLHLSLVSVSSHSLTYQIDETKNRCRHILHKFNLMTRKYLG